MKKHLLALAAIAMASGSAYSVAPTVVGAYQNGEVNPSETLPAPDPNWEIITEQPEGVLTLYSRTCQALRESYEGIS